MSAPSTPWPHPVSVPPATGEQSGFFASGPAFGVVTVGPCVPPGSCPDLWTLPRVLPGPREPPQLLPGPSGGPAPPSWPRPSRPRPQPGCRRGALPGAPPPPRDQAEPSRGRAKPDGSRLQTLPSGVWARSLTCSPPWLRYRRECGRPRGRGWKVPEGLGRMRERRRGKF